MIQLVNNEIQRAMPIRRNAHSNRRRYPSYAFTPGPRSIIKSVSVTHWWRADLGITLNGSQVSAWADQIGSAHLVQESSTSQPQYSAADATFNNKATITSDGSNDLLSCTVNLAGPIYITSVVKLITTANSAPIYGWDFSTGTYLQTFNAQIYQSGPSVNANVDVAVAAMTGNWARFRDRRLNNAADYIKCGNRAPVSGLACPLTVGSQTFAIAGGASFLSASYREIIICAGEPTSAELTDIDTYFAAQGSMLQ